MKRFCALLLAALLLAGMLPVSAFGAAEVSVAQKAADLEQKYGIRIQYSSASNALTTQSLEILDLALENVTPALVKQVSAYYEQKNGTKLTYSYIVSNDDTSGTFYPDRSLIELYFPGTGKALTVTGENPISIVHEFGHAFHMMAAASYGENKMREEWTAFNGGSSYTAGNLAKNPDEKTFITAYASSDYHEDVAETFAHAFVRNKPGQGFGGRITSGSATTGLGRKVAYVEQLVASYGNDQALANYRRVYSTASSVTYQSMKFSGPYLQYAGYPQPRYMLASALEHLGLQKDRAVWLRSIGGWYVKSTAGQEVILFPGGDWCEVGSKFVPPATGSN